MYHRLFGVVCGIVVLLFAFGGDTAWAQVVVGGSEGDSHFYFFDSGSPTGQSLWWDDSGDEFRLTAGLDVEGSLCFGSVECWHDGGSDLISSGGNSLLVGGSLSVNSNALFLNADGPDGDSIIYFHEGNSTGSWLLWDDSQDWFELNDTLRVANNIIVGTTSSVEYNLFGMAPSWSVDVMLWKWLMPRAR